MRRWYPWLITGFCIAFALNLYALPTGRHPSALRLVIGLAYSTLLIVAVVFCVVLRVIARRQMRRDK